MEKLTVPNRKKVENAIRKSYDESMSKDEFKALVTRLKISEKTIMQNVTKLNDTIDELKKCKSCKGLYECKNRLEGYVYFPEKYEDRINFVYTPCKYKKKFDTDAKNKVTSKSELDNARMKDIDIKDKNRIEIIKWLKNFYDNYDPNKKQKGLFLHGSFGAGKTFLISALFNELMEKKHVNSEIVYFPELLRSLRDNFDLLERKVEYYKNIDLLLIDDIGAENVSSWGRDEILGSILQYRMTESMPTFFTSNLNIKELESHLAITKNTEDFVKARRIIERVKQLTNDIELVSSNRRN